MNDAATGYPSRILHNQILVGQKIDPNPTLHKTAGRSLDVVQSATMTVQEQSGSGSSDLIVIRYENAETNEVRAFHNMRIDLEGGERRTYPGSEFFVASGSIVQPDTEITLNLDSAPSDLQFIATASFARYFAPEVARDMQ